MKDFPFRQQPPNSKACGAACLQMVAAYYRKDYKLAFVMKLCKTTSDGTTLFDMTTAAQQLGFHTIAAQINYLDFNSNLKLPCIVHLSTNHFVVIYKITAKSVYVADPASFLSKYSKSEFFEKWKCTDDLQGIVLLLEPTDKSNLLKSKYGSDGTVKEVLFKFISSQKRICTLVMGSLVLSNALILAIPFLTQVLVDRGVQNKNIEIIYLVLTAQLFIFLGRSSLDFLRQKLIVKLSGLIDASLLREYFTHLAFKTISFIDSIRQGEVLQGVYDIQRTGQFLTVILFRTMFALLNLVVFTCILAFYSYPIVLIFLLFCVLNFSWIYLFMNKRAVADSEFAANQATHHNFVLEMVRGFSEAKMYKRQYFLLKRWHLSHYRMHLSNFKLLNISQLQTYGGAFINEIKNIIIVVFAAQLVIRNELTLGEMLSLSYIVGQVNIPLVELANSMQLYQDAKLSVDRVNPILENEVAAESNHQQVLQNKAQLISIQNLSYSYNLQVPVLSSITFQIRPGKITAIMGSSGCGKTTVLKLLLGISKPLTGSIRIGENSLHDVSVSEWQSQCAVVWQDGFIFFGSIKENIIFDDLNCDEVKMKTAAKVANIDSFINGLPNLYETQIGGEEMKLSAGQKQRLLLARAIYKEPNYLFLDEFTSCLDIESEEIIMKNLRFHFKNKTIVMVAHRHSVVVRADHLILLDSGSVVESGSLSELSLNQNSYFNRLKQFVN